MGHMLSAYDSMPIYIYDSVFLQKNKHGKADMVKNEYIYIYREREITLPL